jgi:hypothetical protein
MTFDIRQMKPGWSLSRLKTFSCPLRFARKYIEGRSEPVGEAAQKGTIVAACMAEWRLRWLESGVDVSTARTQLEIVARRTAAEEKIPEAVVEDALELVYEAIRRMGAQLLPDRSNVARWWIEERLAFDHDWARIRFAEKDAKWWGSAQQRKQTWFRAIPDFAWLDTDGVLHIEDDKSGWGKVTDEQVHAYGYAVSTLLPTPPERIDCRYNMVGQGKVDQAPTVTPADVSGFPAWLQAQVDRITGETAWAPVIGKQCDWCGFKAECPAMQSAATDLTEVPPEAFRVPSTVEEVVRGGLWLLLAQECVQIARKKLEEGMGELSLTSCALPGTGKELRWNPVRVAEGTARDVLNAVGPKVVELHPEMDADEVRRLLLESLVVSKGKAEAAAKKLFPRGGKGITAEVKSAHGAALAEVSQRLSEVLEEKPRKAVFGVFNAREDEAA